MVFVTKEVIPEWRKWYLAMKHSIPSTSTYQSFINKFIPDEGIDINQNTVNKFRMENMSCPSSGALKSLFGYLVNKKGADSDILKIRFDRNKSVRKYPESVSEKEIEMIINHMENLRCKILTIFIFDLGVRISEALKLRWEDFNWSEWLSDKEKSGTVIFRVTKRDKFRVMPIRSKLMGTLYNVCEKKTENGLPIAGLVFNFGEGLPSYLQDKEFTPEENYYRYLDYTKNYYRKVLERVSLQHIGRKVKPHMLRHSKAQLLMDKGMSIESLKRFLGHSSISTTEIYAQASPEKLRKELEQFDNFDKQQEPKDLNTLNNI